MKSYMLVAAAALMLPSATAGAQLQEMRQTIFGMD